MIMMIMTIIMWAGHTGLQLAQNYLDSRGPVTEGPLQSAKDTIATQTQSQHKHSLWARLNSLCVLKEVLQTIMRRCVFLDVSTLGGEANGLWRNVGTCSRSDGASCHREGEPSASGHTQTRRQKHNIHSHTNTHTQRHTNTTNKHKHFPSSTSLTDLPTSVNMDWTVCGLGNIFLFFIITNVYNRLCTQPHTHSTTDCTYSHKHTVQQTVHTTTNTHYNRPCTQPQTHSTTDCAHSHKHTLQQTVHTATNTLYNRLCTQPQTHSTTDCAHSYKHTLQQTVHTATNTLYNRLCTQPQTRSTTDCAHSHKQTQTARESVTWSGFYCILLYTLHNILTFY